MNTNRPVPLKVRRRHLRRRRLYRRAGFGFAFVAQLGAVMCSSTTLAAIQDIPVAALSADSVKSIWSQPRPKNGALQVEPAIAMSQGQPPAVAIPGEILKRIPGRRPSAPPPPADAKPPESRTPTSDNPPRPLTAEALTSDLVRDTQLALAFRDKWLAQFAGNSQPLALSALVDPELARWANYSYSIGALIGELQPNPIRRENPPVVGTTIRMTIQLALAVAFGGDSILGGRGTTPRDVWDEKVADQLAHMRTNAMENAVREYLGPDQAAVFRVAKPAEKVNWAAQAAHEETGLEIIGKAVGEGSPLYTAYLDEPNLRLKSNYLADAFVAPLRTAIEVSDGRGDIDAFLTSLEFDYAKERENAERVIVETLGKDAVPEFRTLGGAEKESFLKMVLLLKYIGITSWTFITLTPENLQVQ
jgi:hypothetical protein